jgi:hypothetical protein
MSTATAPRVTKQHPQLPRIDEMSLEKISDIYRKHFGSFIKQSTFEAITDKIRETSNDFQRYLKRGYKLKGKGQGRNSMAWGRTTIYGWYVERLMQASLLQNPKVKSVELIGGDAAHCFTYDHSKKEISVVGEKTTEPDLLVRLKSRKKFSLEIKTAARNVFSVKLGNLKRLYKDAGQNQRYALLAMIDLLNGSYDIKDPLYFEGSEPFKNDSMEGQICFKFPAPKKPIQELFTEDLNKYLNAKLFSTEKVKNHKAIKTCQENGKIQLAKTIEKKMFHDEIEEFIRHSQKALRNKEKALRAERQKAKKRFPSIDRPYSQLRKVAK